MLCRGTSVSFSTGSLSLLVPFSLNIQLRRRFLRYPKDRVGAQQRPSQYALSKGKRLSKGSTQAYPGSDAKKVDLVTEEQDFFAIRKNVGDVVKRVEEIMASAGLEQAEANLHELEHKAAETSLWDDPKKAQETLLAITDAKEYITLLKNFEAKAEDAKTIIQLVEESASRDHAFLHEASQIVQDLNNDLDRYWLTRLLSGPYDKEGACLYITAGAGGIDAQSRTGLI